MIVDCAIYQDGRRTEGPGDFSEALAQARRSGDAFLWIGLHEPTEEEFGRVSQDFGLHPLAVEDALRAHQRPKLEVYDDSLFAVLKPVVYEPHHDTVSADELMIFIGDSFVVTVRHGESAPLADVRSRLEAEPEILAHGPTAVLYAISDAVVDHYIDVAGSSRWIWRSWRPRSSPRAGAAAPPTRRRASTRSSGRCWSSAGPPVR